jgi:hypothetical protein
VEKYTMVWCIQPVGEDPPAFFVDQPQRKCGLIEPN